MVNREGCLWLSSWVSVCTILPLSRHVHTTTSGNQRGIIHQSLYNFYVTGFFWNTFTFIFTIATPPRIQIKGTFVKRHKRTEPCFFSAIPPLGFLPSVSLKWTSSTIPNTAFPIHTWYHIGIGNHGDRKYIHSSACTRRSNIEHTHALTSGEWYKTLSVL